MDIDQLLSIADSVLRDTSSPTQVKLSQIEDYTKAFEAWLAAQGGEQGLIQNKIFSREQLTDLAEKHSAVLGLVDGLKGQTVEDLKGLESRGRAILAYANTLPDRISRMKDKKG